MTSKNPAANIVWRNASFRGYADHIGSAEFSHGLDGLLELSGRLRTTLLCAEAMWWRCHRAMIADVLRVCGIEVVPTDRLKWKKQRCGWRTLRETAFNVLKLARCANAPRKIRTRSFATQPSVVFHAFSIGKT